MTEDRRNHTRARLEAFSDIVFGFSLAQLALTLPPPAHLALIRPIILVSFILTFAFLSFIWWRHHLIFRDYFVAEGASIVLNFVMLAAVALTSYALEAQMNGNLEMPAFVLYACVLGTMYVSMSAMIARGLPLREQLTDELRKTGKKTSLTFGIMGSIFLGSLLLLPLGTAVAASSWALAVLARAFIARRMR